LDENFFYDNSVNDSSDDEKPWVKEVRKNYRLIKKNEKKRERENEDDNNLITRNEPKIDKIKNEVKFEEGGPQKKKQNKYRNNNTDLTLICQVLFIWILNHLKLYFVMFYSTEQRLAKDWKMKRHTILKSSVRVVIER